MNSIRYDLYKDVHKGIRKALFDLATLSGSTEFQTSDSLQQLKDQFSLTYNLLEVHAHSEDMYVEPLVQECNAQLGKDLSSAHQKLDARTTVLQDLLNNLDANQKDVIKQGRSFYLELTKFVGEYLQHIADEEQIIMPLLWENFDDEKLFDVSIVIRANIPPPVMTNFLSCMIPAMNHSERVIMLNGMKQAVPPEVFNGVCQLGKSVLSTSDWQKLSESTSTPVEA